MTLFTTTLTQGPDTLVFTGHDLFDIPWTIDALGGNDNITINGGTITSGGGDWTICNLGDGDDYVRVNGGYVVQVHGDSGNDQADFYSKAFFDGGLGDDTLNIFGGTRATFSGGPGADTANFYADVEAYLFGNEGADVFVGNAHVVSGSISGGDGDDIFGYINAPVGSSLTLAGGLGSDLFRGSVSGMNGVVIADFHAGDLLMLTGVDFENFQFSLSGNTLTYTGGSLTFGSVLNGTLHAGAIGGRVVLKLNDPINFDPAYDFNGDGRSDVLWRDDNGTVTDWLGQGNGGFLPNHADSLIGVPTGWTIAGTGDFNGDYRDDILWRNSTGDVIDWLGQADGGFVSNQANTWIGVPTSWSIAGVGDFDGDGHDDVLWRNSNGTVIDWLGQANGGFLSNQVNSAIGVPASWSVAGVGDFDGDGRDDVLWRNSDGSVIDWLGQANGGFVGNQANCAIGVPVSWHVEGVGDFNGDGRCDVLWRNDNGVVTDWLGQMNGGFAPNHGNSMIGVPLSWTIAAIGDFNGDLHDDVLWRNLDGTVLDWLGQANGGFAGNQANFALGTPLGWHVQAPDLL